jgi:hypothetical protein
VSLPRSRSESTAHILDQFGYPAETPAELVVHVDRDGGARVWAVRSPIHHRTAAASAGRHLCQHRSLGDRRSKGVRRLLALTRASRTRDIAKQVLPPKQLLPARSGPALLVASGGFSADAPAARGGRVAPPVERPGGISRFRRVLSSRFHGEPASRSRRMPPSGRPPPRNRTRTG